MPGATRQDMGAVRKTEIWIAGEIQNAITDAADTKKENEREYPVFGVDENLRDKKTTGGNVDLKTLTRAGELAMLNMLMGYAPDATSVLEVDPDAGQNLPVWFNYRSPDDSEYLGARFFNNWAPAPVADETASPDDVSQRNFTGGCDRPLQISNAFIYSEKIAMASGAWGYSGTCTHNGYKPENSDYYCLGIVAISGSGNGIKFSAMQRGAQLLNGAGVAVINADDARDLPDDWNGKMTSALVIKAGTGTGTWKTIGNTPIPTTGSW